MKQFHTLLCLAFAVVLPCAAQEKGGQGAIATATKEKPFINSLGMKFVPVPGTKAFFCVHETRRSDYAAFAKKTQGLDVSWKSGAIGAVRLSVTEAHPVINVIWNEAIRFCEWLDYNEKPQKQGFAYRLPTDREWSYAVGIAEMEDPNASAESKNETLKGIFPWGKTWPPPKGIGNFGDLSCKRKFPRVQAVASYDDGYFATAPVMSYPPNELGIFDLGGNVGEWCDDWVDGTKKHKIVRGSSWMMFMPEGMHSCARMGITPEGLLLHGQVGFRVVLAPVAAKSGPK